MVELMRFPSDTNDACASGEHMVTTHRKSDVLSHGTE
jgi:hypothetical protein